MSLAAGPLLLPMELRVQCAAHLSADRRYRYWLQRIWDEARPAVAFIGVNPSTADEAVDDPTIRREIGFAQRWGFGSLLALNVGAFRSTDPRQWRAAPDPIGPENSVEHLRRYLAQFNVQRVVAAWGNNGAHCAGQCADLVRQIPALCCLGINADGSPRHPLMVPYAAPCVPLGASSPP